MAEKSLHLSGYGKTEIKKQGIYKNRLIIICIDKYYTKL